MIRVKLLMVNCCIKEQKERMEKKKKKNDTSTFNTFDLEHPVGAKVNSVFRMRDRRSRVFSADFNFHLLPQLT